MKFFTHPAAVALGIATLCSLSLSAPLISPTHDVVYHLNGPAASLFVPVTLDLCLLWLILTGLFYLAERSSRPRSLLWMFLLLFLPFLLLKNWCSLVGRTWPREGVLLSFVPALLVLLIAALAWRRHGAAFLGRIQHFAASVLGFASLLGIVVLVQLVWFGRQARALNSTPHLHQSSVVSTPAALRPRIIWILFDELSFQQVYERRYPGLRLPALDRLAADSTVFTRVQPTGIYTSVAVPSLFTGLSVDSLRISAAGLLLALHNPRTGVWQPFDPHQTVFQDALDRGDSTAVAGWYIPYCRILAPVLDRCFWTSRLPFHGHMYANRSVASNLIAPFRSIVYSSWNHLSPALLSPLDADIVRMHIADYEDLFSASDALLRDPSYTFIFLHEPIPHPGGIFDRRRDTFTTSRSSYIDNLVLADHYLAHVRQMLEQRGEWDSSTVVVMGDHSWRTSLLWARSPVWTHEDQLASHGGQFDDRPAYIVKLPHQQNAARIDTPFAALRTRSLFDALLSNRLQTSAQLKAWAERPPS